MDNRNNRISGDQWAIITCIPVMIVGAVILAIYAPGNAVTILSMMFSGIVLLIGQYATLSRTKLNGDKVDDVSTQVTEVHDTVNGRMGELIDAAIRNAVNVERQRVIDEAKNEEA